MRVALLVVCLTIARVAGAACLDDCRQEFGGAGEDYVECVADCGVCGNGDLEGDEECDDGNTAGGDCCDARCQPEPAGSPCEPDDEPCTSDVCDGDGDCDNEEEPALDCRWPAVDGAATLVLRDAEREGKDLLVWKWRRGEATGKADFGEPTETTAYALCLYDGDGLLASIAVPAGGDCGRQACWTERASGFRYRDRERTPEGAAELVLKQGKRGRARIIVEAGGDDLDLPEPGFLESPLTVQLRRTGGPVCWGARFDFPPAQRHGERRFRDRSAPPPSTTTTTTTVAAASSTTTTPPGGGGTSTTLAEAAVEILVVDAEGAPVVDADVTIEYAGAGEASDFTDDAGIVRFADQPVGVAATLTAEDDDDRTASLASPGFVPGINRLQLTVR